MKIMIITLYSGENEYDSCKESVRIQECSYEVHHVCIENKPKLEAHNLLYSMIMEKERDFDYFVKLDADMVFTSSASLQEIIESAVKNKVDRFSIPVHDYMTDKMIWGLNVYKAGMQWELSTNAIFTDQQKVLVDYRVKNKVLTKETSLVSHASKPTNLQAYLFGVHRASKITQDRTFIPCISNSYAQYKVLADVSSVYIKTKSIVHGYALIGAYAMLKRSLSRSDMEDKRFFKSDYDNVNYDKEIDVAIEFFTKMNIIILVSTIGYSRSALGAFSYLIRKIKL